MITYFLILIYVFQSSHFKIFIKRMVILILILTYPFFRNAVEKETFIYFLDVGQGDAIFIDSPSCNILVDAYRNSSEFLKNKGIYKIDYMILTHSDSDHTIDAYDIIEQIHVRHLIISSFDDNHKQYLIQPTIIKANDHIICGNLELYFLSPSIDYHNPNGNSIVFQLQVEGVKILFTGDIEEQTETHLIDLYGNMLASDVIKVPHHGSSTSSTTRFINYVNPKHAIISVGENNRYHFPSHDVIHRYTMINTNIYRTDHHGTIQYTLSKNKQKWSFYLPF